MKFQVNCPYLVQGKTLKLIFNMVARATILDFPMGTILITFDLQVTLMCPIKFQVNWPFHSGQIQKPATSWSPVRRRIQLSHRGRLLLISESPLYVPTSFESRHFGSGEEAHNRFSRWLPSWISNQNHFYYFWSASHPETSYQVSCPLAFPFRRRSSK